jgi:hypothetical protein
MPRVTVIVLNWNGLDDTLDCLEHLRRLEYPEYDVVTVDNGSTDGSPEAIRERFPEVTLIETGQNLGFAGGNNVGMRYALETGADCVLLLNNDTQVAPDALGHLVEAVQADPRAGVAGPTIYYYDQPEVIWSAGGAVDWRRGGTWMVGLNEQDTGQFGLVPRGVDFVTGCALFARKGVLEQAGLLDERFFMYYEEVEWCLRARRVGFGIVHVPRARVWHKISPESQADSPLVHYYMTRNRLLFLRLTGAGMRAWLHTLLADYLRTLLSWSLRPRWRHKKTQRRVMVQALMDAWDGKWGQQSVV